MCVCVCVGHTCTCSTALLYGTYHIHVYIYIFIWICINTSIYIYKLYTWLHRTVYPCSQYVSKTTTLFVNNSYCFIIVNLVLIEDWYGFKLQQDKEASRLIPLFETNRKSCPENKPKTQKEARSTPNHEFSGALAVGLGRVQDVLFFWRVHMCVFFLGDF